MEPLRPSVPHDSRCRRSGICWASWRPPPSMEPGHCGCNSRCWQVSRPNIHIVNVCIYVYRCMYVYIYIYTCVCVCVRVCVYVYILYTYICVYRYAYCIQCQCICANVKNYVQTNPCAAKAILQSFTRPPSSSQAPRQERNKDRYYLCMITITNAMDS